MLTTPRANIDRNIVKYHHSGTVLNVNRCHEDSNETDLGDISTSSVRVRPADRAESGGTGGLFASERK